MKLNVCENPGCTGSMKTTRITCGRDSGSETRCDVCGRTIEYGWGGSHVLYEGRCKKEVDCLLSSKHDDACLIPQEDRKRL